MSFLFYIIPIIIILGVVVTVHELGHFLAGRWLGTKIDQFSIGFGKALASWRDKSGVDWRIGWIPLGGYVRFAGDDNAASIPDADDLSALRADLVAREGEGALAQYFHFKPIWQRAVITAAGPVANFLLSISIFAVLLMTLGEPVEPVRVDRVEPGTAAERAGFRAGDLVLEANGRALSNPQELKRLIVLRTGVEMDFLVERGGKVMHLTATPARGVVRDSFGGVHQLGQLGVGFPAESHMTIKRYGPLEAIAGGVQQTRDVISDTVFYISRMVVGRENADQISGPLGMAKISGDLTKQTAAASKDLDSFARNSGLMALVLIANISVGIGFLNLLPIPVLDGGHLLFYGYEAIARRPLAAKVQAAGYRVGLALVLGLMLFATWNDLQRLRVFNLVGGLFS